jgi:hypothetical protein
VLLERPSTAVRYRTKGASETWARRSASPKKRQADYKLLSNLRGHPTLASFAMPRPEPDADAHMGGFFVPKMLTATIQELVTV